MIAHSAQTSSDLRITGIAAAKGGVGQSTISLDWARALASRGQHTLLLEIAGGDLAWMAGVSPRQFTEDAARGTVSPVAAAVEAGSNLDVLAAGNEWAVHGCDDPAKLTKLMQALQSGIWAECVIDLGHTDPRRARAAWESCAILAVVIDDDLGCVSRTYALMRHLLDFGWGDRLALVFNHLTDPGHVESLRQRFDQITNAFLGRTFPLIGVVPDGPESRRSAAVAKWVPGGAELAASQTDSLLLAHNQPRMIDAAILADIKI